MVTEADTCRMYVVPALVDAGWDRAPASIAEQRTFTDGRIVVAGERPRRRPQKRADYLLRYRADFTIAVVEAKPEYKLPGDGMQQAKEYAEFLGLKFAYSTNGPGIVEFDFTTGLETELARFPTPDELWHRLRASEGLIDDATAERLLTPSFHDAGKRPRYYQEIAINRVVQAVLQGQRRVLLTMATGTGKTVVAFQICWKLWSAGWNRAGAIRKPRILYLADRRVLVDDPKDKTFAPFGFARGEIANGETPLSREMYFSTYQAIAEDERRPGLYRQYPRDFFDLIVVDECHRGSARDESSWREILDYFEPAYQLGMTATPKRDETADSYRYFGEPVYTYSLAQGIDDGFLAPYRVHRIITRWDAAGWRPNAGERDRFLREIPDREYHTREFEREVALRARTEAIARHLADFMAKTDRFAKTIVFCVDQEHADEMRRCLTNLNADLVREHPDYVCRVTSDEGEIGRGHLGTFQDVETRTPVILTTSQLLTTGVDAPTCTNIVLARVVGSMTEFKQIIGRGTRVRDDYGKLYFNILDYTGTATQNFADPAFDGDPALIEVQVIDDDGKVVGEPEVIEQEQQPADARPTGDGRGGPRRKFYVDGGQVEVVAHLVYELDGDGRQQRVVELRDYTAEKVRTLYPNAAELRERWAEPRHRQEIIELLAARGVDLDHLRAMTGQTEADPFDLLCHVAFNTPIRSRRERAERLRRDEQTFFAGYGPRARGILEDLLEKYAEHGAAQFVLPDVLKVPPISEHGNVTEIVQLFGSAELLREAVTQLQALLYAA